MGKTFKNIYACSVGKFDGNADKIPQWVRANGGRYSKDISEEITHLIASKEAYKGDVETVRKAKRLKSIKIVSYDWLEDSLLSKNRRPKREAEYLLENLLNNEKKRKRETSNKEDEKPKTQPPKKRTGKPKNKDPFGKKTKGVKAGTAVSRYHIYIDKGDRVTYNATLVRLTISMNAREKYVVKVYESNKEPYVYATHVEYSRIGKQQSELLTTIKADRDTAVKVFKIFSKIRQARSGMIGGIGFCPPVKEMRKGNCCLLMRVGSITKTEKGRYQVSFGRR